MNGTLEFVNGRYTCYYYLHFRHKKMDEKQNTNTEYHRNRVRGVEKK